MCVNYANYQYPNFFQKLLVSIPLYIKLSILTTKKLPQQQVQG